MKKHFFFAMMNMNALRKLLHNNGTEIIIYWHFSISIHKHFSFICHHLASIHINEKMKSQFKYSIVHIYVQVCLIHLMNWYFCVFAMFTLKMRKKAISRDITTESTKRGCSLTRVFCKLLLSTLHKTHTHTLFTFVHAVFFLLFS